MQKIHIRPSARLALILTLAHAAAAGISFTVELPLWGHIPLLAAIAASFGHSVYGPALLRSANAVVAVEIGQGEAVCFQTRHGEWHSAVLLDSSFVAPYLTVLNLRPAHSYFARHVVITSDNVPAEDFRRLRVWLRWQKAAAS